ncbi:hypothetical protein CHS0354_027908 [Potamilus streckersoni]|uniref:Uncharacterized protein n=1 Tax=Potamilus streckersoni TaxID=2493646 RepID=A0AAE0W7J3_9BIVA|nr:hypothetical protein CHS0354_027908 [Potamilus streckersoni]
MSCIEGDIRAENDTPDEQYFEGQFSVSVQCRDLSVESAYQMTTLGPTCPTSSSGFPAQRLQLSHVQNQ